MSPQQLSLVFLVLALPGAHARRSGRALRESALAAEAQALTQKTASTEQVSAEAMLEGMAGRALSKMGVRFSEITAFAKRFKTIEEKALRKLAGKVPEDVESIVRLSVEGQEKSTGASSPLTDAAIAKGRVYLNNLAYESVLKTDDIIWECKEFELRNRGAYEQASTDSARLASQLTALQSKRVDSNECVARYDTSYRSVEEQSEKTTLDYNSKRETDSLELTRRKNDLAVFEFLINVTKCPASSSSSSLLQMQGSNSMKICQTPAGTELAFSDPRVQAQFEQKLTPAARETLRNMLGTASGSLGFLQLGAKEAVETTTTTAIIAAPLITPMQRPVNNWEKCVDMPAGDGGPEGPPCAKIHDKISLEWGVYKDSVDVLATEMATDTQNHEAATANYNGQMTQINDAKTLCMETLATSISGINTDTTEKDQKDREIRRLTTAYEEVVLGRCKRQMRKQMEETCGYVKMRNAMLLQASSGSSETPANTNDCEVTNFVSRDGTCYNTENQAITCDDTCPRSDPKLCGGLEQMVRSIIAENNTKGIQCPPLTRRMRCGQKKCPVSCVLSTWSGFSACSKECEGGMQLRTRSILTMAKNGGRACDTVQETRSCNTGSCDRDCTLVDWTEWSHCSAACNGGMQGRSRSVLVPIRGNGRCPREESRRRWNAQECNTQACGGDELCVAQQDLVIALDGSGSVKQNGFDTLKNFAVNLTKRYRSTYFGIESVKMGATLFGNGLLTTAADGTITISPAILTQELTFDLAAVRTSLTATTWQKGFTNMAQALSKADFILSRGGRETAQSAVLVLSDGKPSFKVQTSQKAQELKDKGIMILMAPVMENPTPDELDTLHGWASHPWQTNFELVPGIPALTENSDIFVQKLVVRFCPDASSPGLLTQMATQSAFMLIRENGYSDSTCGALGWVGYFNNIADCAAAAKAAGKAAFAFGKLEAARKCLSSSMTVDQTYWDTYKVNRTNPPCGSGAWLFNEYYDTYALNPGSTSGSSSS